MMDEKIAIREIKILIGLPDGPQKDEIVSILSSSHTVETASDSVEAYKKIHEIDPDIAILDYALSKINPINLSDGISFIHANVYMVICVTDENIEVASWAWNKRALDFIMKPYTTDRFVQDARKILRYIIQKKEVERLRKEVQTLQEEIKNIRLKLN